MTELLTPQPPPATPPICDCNRSLTSAPASSQCVESCCSADTSHNGCFSPAQVPRHTHDADNQPCMVAAAVCSLYRCAGTTWPATAPMETSAATSTANQGGAARASQHPPGKAVAPLHMLLCVAAAWVTTLLVTHVSHVAVCSCLGNHPAGQTYQYMHEPLVLSNHHLLSYGRTTLWVCLCPPRLQLSALAPIQHITHILLLATLRSALTTSLAPSPLTHPPPPTAPFLPQQLQCPQRRTQAPHRQQQQRRHGQAPERCQRVWHGRGRPQLGRLHDTR